MFCVILPLIRLVFFIVLAFFPSYQYAMKENFDENNEKNEENEEEENCTIPDFKENLKKEIKNKNFAGEIEKREKSIDEEVARLSEEKKYLEDLKKKDISKEENYKKLEEYVSEIENKVNTKFI